MPIAKLCLLLLTLTVSDALFAAGCLSAPSMPRCPKDCGVDVCCGKMGGISYCDSSAGRYVCNNGYYSSCYCTRHAVMNLQHLEGCCMWQGGILNTTPEGIVLCRDGGFSALCTQLYSDDKVAVY